jgi:hypothetical protein
MAKKSAQAELLPAVVPDTVIEAVVQTLRTMQEGATLQFALAVGQLVTERFFEGDIQKLRSHGPKDVSLRRLAEHPDLPFSASTLTRAVGVYELVDRLGGVDAIKRLSYSHLRVVLGIPEKQQQRLLEKAANDSWPVVRLETEAQKHRREGRGGGRPPVPTFIKALHAWRRVAGDEGAFDVDPAVVEKLKPEEVVAAREAIAEMQRQLAALAARLASHSAPDSLSRQPLAEGRVERNSRVQRK